MMLNVMNVYVLHDVEQYDCGQSRTAYTNEYQCISRTSVRVNDKGNISLATIRIRSNACKDQCQINTEMWVEAF